MFTLHKFHANKAIFEVFINLTIKLKGGLNKFPLKYQGIAQKLLKTKKGHTVSCMTHLPFLNFSSYGIIGFNGSI
jgi:hypothetical protein